MAPRVRSFPVLGLACLASWAYACSSGRPQAHHSTGGSFADVSPTGGSNSVGAGGTQSGLGGSGGASSSGAGSEALPGCDIAATYETSSAIPTVGIVTWSLASSVSSAHIEFGLAESSETLVAPVDLAEPSYRTLLLGLKQNRNYVFRIVAEAGSGTCVSQDYSLTTGTLANAPTVSHSGTNGHRGFVVTTTGQHLYEAAASDSFAYIFDTDGDVVWLAPAPLRPSRAHMSWDGKDMWMVALNANGDVGTGEMRRVSMDGLDTEHDVGGLSGAHHDFAATPHGLAVIVYGANGCSSIVERSASSGAVTSIIDDVSTVYTPIGSCHTNYIRYYASDDSFTISDRYPNLFVKVRRDGTLQWQFGGTDPKGDAFQLSEVWHVNHGHDLGEDGRLVFFNNTTDSSAVIMEFELSQSSWSASKLWTYAPGPASGTLGDVQRIPGGGYLVTYSEAGVLHEIDGSQRLMQSFTVSGLGYAEFREALYGPPVHY